MEAQFASPESRELGGCVNVNLTMAKHPTPLVTCQHLPPMPEYPVTETPPSQSKEGFVLGALSLPGFGGEGEA